MKDLDVKFEDPDSELAVTDKIKGTIVSEPYSKLLPFEIKEVGDIKHGVSKGSVTCVVVMSEEGDLYEDVPVESLEVLGD